MVIAKFGRRFELLGNRYGVTLYRTDRGGMFNEQDVPQWFAGFARKWGVKSSDTVAGGMRLHIRVFGPFYYGSFTREMAA